MSLSGRLLVALALALAVGLASAISPFASSSPDGLETVAAEQAFSDREDASPLQRSAPAPGYAFPGVANERLATGLSGFVGTLAVFAIGYGLALALRRRRRVAREGGAATA